MEYSFLLYIFATAILILGGSSYFFSTGKTFLAAFFLIGSLMAAIIFGFRWFTAGGELTGTPTGSWPPVMNSCPDFLSLYTVGGSPVCIDTQGVAGSGGMSMWTDPAQTDERYLFRLYTNLTGEARAKQLCNECSSKKVSWEGLFDGTSCTNINPPLPSGAQSIGSPRAAAPAPAPSPSPA